LDRGVAVDDDAEGRLDLAGRDGDAGGGVGDVVAAGRRGGVGGGDVERDRGGQRLRQLDVEGRGLVARIAFDDGRQVADVQERLGRVGQGRGRGEQAGAAAVAG